MIKILQRLEFENIYPLEKPYEIIYYLKRISRQTLLRIIGFCSTNPDVNFNNFFTNPDISKEINDRVYNYINLNKIEDKVVIISTYASLKLAEYILAEIEILQNELISIDDDEINLFKAFLLINSELNERQKLDNFSNLNFEKLVDLYIVSLFPESDLAISDNNNFSFLKQIYCTIFKVEKLFNFLNSIPDLTELKNEFLSSFNVKDENEFLYQMKILFRHLLLTKKSKKYLFEITDIFSLSFLESMTSEKIKSDEDFTHIKNNPIYFLRENVFSIINYFFVVDKFYKSTKFKLKEIYKTIEPINKKFGDFFGFFNKEFSEKFLMKIVLDSIFDKRYLIKKTILEAELDGEPDYYVRHNNTIYIFENKDVLVSKQIKSSANIELINNYLSERFLFDGKKPVGIGQLINSIEEILTRNFPFDEYVNSKNNLEIFPILIIQDRIFQTPGINYRLNKWFVEELNSRFKEFNLSRIRGLTVIDIDTLIIWQPYLVKKDKNFKELLVNHLQKMQTNKISNTNDIDQVNKNLTNQLNPISSRFIPFSIDKSEILNKFKDIKNE